MAESHQPQEEIQIVDSKLKVEDSFYVWIGTKPSTMQNLYAAVNSNFDSVPSVTRLFGSFLNDSGQQIARRLALKTGKLCFVSYNLPTHIPQLQEYAEKKLFEKIKEFCQ